MKHKSAPWLILMTITAVAGLLLGITNTITAPIIEERTLAVANESRYVVFSDADDFRALELKENASVSDCYEALKDGTVVGHVGTVTVKGYGGEIEVRVGLDLNAVITGISVGGPNFSESAGLGARTRDPEFTDQFRGVQAPVTLGQNVDAISGATISSGAVVSGVNKIVKYVANLNQDASETDLYHNILSGTYTELPHDDTIEQAYQVEAGYAVFTVAKGFHGDIHVMTLLDENGVVKRVSIDETDFVETAGLGERVLEGDFLKQYEGKSGVIGVNPSAYGVGDTVSAATEDSDGESGATGEAEKGTALTTETDGESGATGEAEKGTALATESDGESGATGEAERGTAPATESDGESGATGEADAESSASVKVESIEGAEATIDGVSGATISSTAVTKAVNAAIAFVRSLRS